LNFYIFFELSVIPIAIIIIVNGINPERLQASTYILIYTFLGSIPLFFCIIIKYITLFSISFRFQTLSCKLNKKTLMLFWILVFLIKIPVYGFHLWLPKAHVEAPLEGRMILAALMLKLGAYGFLRFNFFFLNKMFLQCILIFWGLLNLIWCGWICFRTKDIKTLIAYSSVVHMILVFLSLALFQPFLCIGMIVILISHGLIRRLLFMTFGSLYNLSLSRKILSKRNILNFRRILVFWWFLGASFKASIPPSLSLLGEIYMFLLRSTLKKLWVLGLISLIFSVGLYKIFLYIKILQGPSSFHPLENSNQKITSLLHIFILVSLWIISDILFF